MYDFYRQINDWRNQSPIYGTKVFYDATLHGGNIEFVIPVSSLTEANDFRIWKDLNVHDDATIQGDLRVDGFVRTTRLEYNEIQVIDSSVRQDLRIGRNLYVEQNAAIGHDLLVYDDATIKGFLHFQKGLIGTLPSTSVFESQDFNVWKDLVVQDDATVKGDFRVEGEVFGIDHDKLDNFVVAEHRVLDDDNTSSVTLWSSTNIQTKIFNLREQLSVKYEDGSSPDFQDANIHKDLIIQDDATIKDALYVEGRIKGTVDDAWRALEAQDFNVWRDLVVQDDATVKDTLRVNRLIDAQDVHIHKDFIVQHDATVKDSMIVEGFLKAGNLEYDRGEAQDFFIWKDLVVQDDATVKDDLYVEGRIKGTVDNATQAVEAQDFKAHKDLIVQDDATVKNDLYVDGRIKGTVDNAVQATEAQDFKVHKNLVGQDDATVKDSLYVDGKSYFASTIHAQRQDDGTPTLIVSGESVFEDSVLVRSDATIKEDLYIEGRFKGTLASTSITESQDFWVYGDLGTQDDATVKGNLLVEGEVFLPAVDEWQLSDTTISSNLLVRKKAHVEDNLIVDRDAFIGDDATIKGSLRVETAAEISRLHVYGLDTHTADGTYALEVQGDTLFHRNLTVYDDATVKDDLYVEGLIYGTVADLSTAETQDFKIWKDLIVQDDATVKDFLRIEGHLDIIGTHNIVAASSDNAADFDVFRDLVVHDDATVKDTFKVEGRKGDVAYGASQHTLLHAGNMRVEIGVPVLNILGKLQWYPETLLCEILYLRPVSCYKPTISSSPRTR